MKSYKRHTVTAALPYANGPLHIGHLAGAYLPADIYSRYLRAKGKDVVFICGSDEHGAAITLRAKKEGISPEDLINKYHNQFKESFKKLGISFDFYHRTSSKLHHQTASDFFKKLYDKGSLFEKESEQYFDTVHNQFLADRYIMGTCPHCGHPDAYGDQCEKCGSDLSPKELINVRSMLSDAKPEMRKTKHWYFPLDKYEDWMKKWILDEHKKDWKVNVYGQCKSWIKQGLKARAFTRDLDWGVPVPLADAKGKVLYVWVDAPVGYISATKAWAVERAEKQSGGEYSPDDWKKYWQDNDTQLVHFIGKDNIVFHCIMFPAMLKEHGDFILPDNVPANEFMNLEGQKISTSRNWGVWLDAFTSEHPGKEDVLRYALCASAPETKDSDFSWKDFQSRNNSELVAIFGNLVNRIIVLTHKFYDGNVPEKTSEGELELSLMKLINEAPDKIGALIEKYHFREALTELMKVARAGNKYLTETEPWKLQKTEAEKAANVLYHGMQAIAGLAILSEPFLPFTSAKLKEVLGIQKMNWNDVKQNTLINAGTKISECGHLFSLIDDKFIEKEVEKLHKQSAETANANQPSKQEKAGISFEDFTKMNIITATIKAAEKVPKTSKLLKITLSIGSGEERTVVSGIASFYSAEEVIGKKVCLLENLEPKKIRGVNSHGMILMAEDKDGKLSFVKPENKVEDGSGVR